MHLNLPKERGPNRRPSRCNSSILSYITLLFTLLFLFFSSSHFHMRIITITPHGLKQLKKIASNEWINYDSYRTRKTIFIYIIFIPCNIYIRDICIKYVVYRYYRGICFNAPLGTNFDLSECLHSMDPTLWARIEAACDGYSLPLSFLSASFSILSLFLFPCGKASF